MGRSAAPARLLVVDDEQMMIDMIGDALRFAGYDVDVAGDGPSALSTAVAQRPDLVVLDVGLPGIDGFAVAQRLRAQHPDLPILFLTARSGAEDVRHGFENGADDYLTKPFRLEELRLRIEAVLRRTRPPQGVTAWRCGDLVLDDATHRVTRRGRVLDLAPIDYRLLRHLLQHAGAVVTRPRLLEAVWGYEYGPSVIDTAIWQLRKKVDEHGPKLIHTVRGYGYTLREP